MPACRALLTLLDMESSALRRLGLAVLCLCFLVVPPSAALVLRVQPASPAAEIAAPPVPATVERTVGPGPLRTLLRAYGYRLELHATPNRVAARPLVSVALSMAGRPVNGAHVAVSFTSLEMKMRRLSWALPQTGAGHYAARGAALSMDGRWRIHVVVSPTGEQAFVVGVVDRVA
jgi:hypothetical protein